MELFEGWDDPDPPASRGEPDGDRAIAVVACYVLVFLGSMAAGYFIG